MIYCREHGCATERHPQSRSRYALTVSIRPIHTESFI